MSNSAPAEVIEYQELRLIVGLLGVLFPVILIAFGLCVFPYKFQESLSDYYGTPLRDIFVGFLTAIGVFLI